MYGEYVVFKVSMAQTPLHFLILNMTENSSFLLVKATGCIIA